MAGGPAHYRAFISYSHRDAAFAGRLHRWLEGYALPRQLGGQRRLSPIFKDREELPAAADLSAQVRAALAVSDCLIVVCSPDAAASPWVGREIETFRRLDPDRPILAALVRGEPAEAFPPALSAGDVEPLAADFRKAGDGERLARLKLAAGIAGVGVDRLVQRDAQRRLQGVMAVTAVAVMGMLAMGLTTAFALSARAEAERQRALAEGMVEFMQSDLRDRLKGVGRLDALESATRFAVKYYEGQDIERLPFASQERWALLLEAMGEDLLKRGKLDEGREKFLAAQDVTKRLLRAEPNNPDLLWSIGQSEFWIGYAASLKPDASETRKAWESYRLHAERLVQVGGANTRNRRELAFADGNLCTLAVDIEHDFKAAMNSCKSALDLMTTLLAERPGDPEQQADVANRHGWMADAYCLDKQYQAARAHRLVQERMLGVLMAGDPKSMPYRQRWVANQRALATLDARQQRFSDALQRLGGARAALAEMIAFEPDNVEYKQQMTMIDTTVNAINKIANNN